MPEAQAKRIEREVQEGSLPRKAGALIKTLGPGVITGASDDDPSTMGTFAQTGVQFGYAQLWMILFTLPLMVVIQEICARIGLQTGSNLARLIRKHYPKPIIYLSVALLFIANTINIGADLGAMAASAQLVINIPFIFWLIAITAVAAGLEIFIDYEQYSKVLRFFALFLLAYVIVAFVVPQDWGRALKSTIVPTMQFNQAFLMNLVALLGTAISPYLFFWQTSEEVEEKKEAGETEENMDDGHEIEEGQKGVSRVELKWMRTDVAAGMVLANFVGWTIIITAASTLGKQGIHNLDSTTQFAKSLEPVLGAFANPVFALGIIGTGLISVPVLAGSLAYAVAGTVNITEGLSLDLDEAPGFYGIIAIAMVVGGIINLLGINPIQALYYTAIINGVVAAPMLVLLMLIANNKSIMKDKTNGRFSNVLGWITTGAMLVSAIALIYSMVTGGH